MKDKICIVGGRVMREKKERNIIIGLLCVAILVMSIGFAVLSTNLNINGAATVKANSWDVHFENIANKSVLGGAVVSTEPTIDSLFTTVNYGLTLNQPGDKYSFTVDVVNNGSIDARLHSISVDGVTTEQSTYVKYSVVGMTQDEVLAAGTSKTITITVEYDATVTAENLPTTDQTLNLTATLNFVQN